MTHVGFYENDGAGWGLVMNTQTGNVGIATEVPTEKLDVAGNVKVTGLWMAALLVRMKPSSVWDGVGDGSGRKY